MATRLTFALPSVPSGFSTDTPASCKNNVAAPKQRTLELLGPKFQAFVRRKFHNRTISEDEKIQLEIYGNNDDDQGEESEEEVEASDLARSDPRDWKSQDHYQVLGLSKYRYKATDDQIKRAFHRKVLRHHPDKKAAMGNTNDDGFFKCIQKAHEILTNTEKRRQYDSVDSFYPDNFPSAKAKGEFFTIWAPVFEREGRFSKKQPAPSLGDENTPREVVESFYDFWYNFESWRSFEYLDKEDADGDNRDNKRYIESKNKKERAQRKKDDNNRVLSMVDTAIAVDPRILKFKEDDKARRNAKKAAKAPNPKTAALEKAKREEEERLAKEKADQEAKENAGKDKKAKEALKKAIRKEKKAIRETVQSGIQAIDASRTQEQIDAQLEKLEQAFEKIGLDKEGLAQIKAKVDKLIADKSKDLLEKDF